MNTTPRLNRLLAKDGRCFDVAIDHGFFNERSFLDNIEDMHHVIATIIEANPDAVQLSPGLAPLLQNIPGHRILTAALDSHRQAQVVRLKSEGEQ